MSDISRQKICDMYIPVHGPKVVSSYIHVGSLELQVSFAKKPYERDDILQILWMHHTFMCDMRKYVLTRHMCDIRVYVFIYDNVCHICMTTYILMSHMNVSRHHLRYVYTCHMCDIRIYVSIQNYVCHICMKTYILMSHMNVSRHHLRYVLTCATYACLSSYIRMCVAYLT